MGLWILFNLFQQKIVPLLRYSLRAGWTYISGFLVGSANARVELALTASLQVGVMEV